MHFVIFLISIGGAGDTFGVNKVRNDPRLCVNPPRPIPTPKKVTSFSDRRTRASSSICYYVYSISLFYIIVLF